MVDCTAAIQEIIDRETRAWDTQDADLLLTVLHPDMVWPWPPHPRAHDPLEWSLEWGRYNADRWRKGWQQLFDTHALVHNRRVTRKITVSAEADGPSPWSMSIPSGVIGPGRTSTGWGALAKSTPSFPKAGR
jgi:hypothetical protein